MGSGYLNRINFALGAMGRVAIIVAFDLHGVKSNKKFSTYTNIKKDLAKLRLNKFFVTSSGKTAKLPANTFIGVLSGPKLFEKDAAKIRNVAREKVKKIIAKHHKGATVLVFVGKKWALSKSHVP